MHYVLHHQANHSKQAISEDAKKQSASTVYEGSLDLRLLTTHRLLAPALGQQTPVYATEACMVKIWAVVAIASCLMGQEMRQEQSAIMYDSNVGWKLMEIASEKRPSIIPLRRVQ